MYLKRISKTNLIKTILSINLKFKISRICIDFYIYKISDWDVLFFSLIAFVLILSKIKPCHILCFSLKFMLLLLVMIYFDVSIQK